MAEKYLVLYAEPSGATAIPRRGVATRGVARTRGAVATRRGGESRETKLTVESLTSKQRIDAQKDPNVKAIAGIMPMKLIKPVKKGRNAVASAEPVAWGIEATKALTSTATGSGIVVAVLDTGIDKTHPAFAGMNIVQKDFTGEGNGDQNGHGTHCAGTIFGKDVNGSRIGIARGISKALIGKVLGEEGGGSSKMILDAIRWSIEQGANIISMSLGMDFPGYVKELQADGYPTELAASKALEEYRSNVLLFYKMAELIQTQSDEGFTQPVQIIAAAGNESRRPTFEIAVSPPAVSDGIISVAALGKSTANKWVVADFSNTGAIISGPGVDILSARSGGGLVKFSGTSMATPHVAGIAALWAEKLKSQNQFNRDRLLAALLANASTNTLVISKASAYGAGMVQAPV